MKPKFANARFESDIINTALNATKGKVVTVALDQDGDPSLGVNYKTSPSLRELQDTLGTQEAIAFLQGEGRAIGVLGARALGFKV